MSTSKFLVEPPCFWHVDQRVLQSDNPVATCLIERENKRLEERKVIAGYTIVASPASLGYPIQAMVRINPLPGAMKDVECLIQDSLQIVECDRVTGEDCFYARLYCRSIDDLDVVLEPFHERARTNTAIIKGQSVERRLPPLQES